MARVLVVSFSVVPGPDRHGVQLIHILKALASRFSVDVLTLRVGDLAYVERLLKTRMLRVPLPDAPLSQQVEAFRRALRRQLEGAEYDVVHFRDGWSGLPIIERAQTLGYQTVFDVGRSTLGEPRPADTKLAADLERDEEICYRQADLVVVPTELCKAFLADKVDAGRLLVVPPGVDVDRFDAEVAEASTVPRIVYLGGIAPGNGVRTLLRAVRDVLQRTPTKLTLVGPVEKGFSEPLTAIISTLGLDEHVELLGPIENEDIPRILARAAICVAPQAADVAERPTAAFPTKLLEYMACCRPVVAPRRSSVSELIDDNVDGVLFDPGNARDLATQLVRLLVNPDLRDRLALAGYRKVRDHYPASATRRRLLEAYSRLIPIAAWQPLAVAAPPVHITQQGPITGVIETDGPNWEPVDEESAGPPTTVSAPPPEILADTGMGAVRVRLADDTTDSIRAAPPPDNEAWVVVGPNAQPSRRRSSIRSSASADLDGDGTPIEGVLIAGELEVRDPNESTGEIELDEESFIAASEILGPPTRPPPARPPRIPDDSKKSDKKPPPPPRPPAAFKR